MRKLQIFGFTVLISIASFTQAYPSYQSSFFGTVSTSENNAAERQVFSTSFIHYLEPIQISSTPYGLTTFLQPTSNLFLGLLKSSTDTNGDRPDYDTEELVVRGTHFFDYNRTTFYTSFSLSSAESDYDFSPRRGKPLVESTVYGIKFGAYLTDHATLEFEHRYLDQDLFDVDTRHAHISYLRYRQTMALSSGRWLYFKAGLKKRDFNKGTGDEQESDLYISYFLNQRINLGMSYVLENAQDSGTDTNTLGFSLKNYFNPSFALSFDARIVDLDKSSDDVEILGIGLTYQI